MVIIKTIGHAKTFRTTRKSKVWFCTVICGPTLALVVEGVLLIEAHKLDLKDPVALTFKDSPLFTTKAQRRIKFLGIPVRNQDRALLFYTEKLGFRILTDQEFSATQR